MHHNIRFEHAKEDVVTVTIDGVTYRVRSGYYKDARRQYLKYIETRRWNAN